MDYIASGYVIYFYGNFLKSVLIFLDCIAHFWNLNLGTVVILDLSFP